MSISSKNGDDKTAEARKRAIKAIEEDDAAALAQIVESEPAVLRFKRRGAGKPRLPPLLYVATMSDISKCVEVLVKAGCGVHERFLPPREEGIKHQSATPLALAIYCKNPAVRAEMFKSLMASAGREIEAHALSWGEGMAAAAYRGDIDIMKELNAYCGREGVILWATFRNDALENMLHVAASAGIGGRDAFRLLLSWEGMWETLGELNNDKQTPRDVARCEGSVELVKELDAAIESRRVKEELSQSIEAAQKNKGMARARL